MPGRSELVIISVAHGPVLPVWKYASRLLSERFPGARKIVIVPAKEIPLFQKATAEGFLVRAEDEVMAPWAKKFRSASAGGLANRRGWYLQQLLKIQALIDYSDSANLLIWDADTLPLQNIDFFGSEAPRYFLGTEHNGKYFETITKLFGPLRHIESSFIAQCFPIRGADIKRFVRHLESKHEVGAMDALIDAIDFSHPASFSEYETLGAFLTSVGAFAEQPKSRSWSRNGWRRIGSPRIAYWFYRSQEHPDLAYAAFERKPKVYRMRSSLKGLIRQIGSVARKAWSLSGPGQQ